MCQNFFFFRNHLLLRCRLNTISTCEGILVAVQGGELLPVVTGQRVSSIALVSAQTQAVRLALRLQVEAAVLRVDLLLHPVLHLHQQPVVSLLAQVVDVLQAQPVLAVYVAKAFLEEDERYWRYMEL